MELKKNTNPEMVAFYQMSSGLKARGGGDSLIKVGTDVRRVQAQGRAKFLQENLLPRQKSAQKIMTGQVFMNFIECQNWKFSASRSHFSLFYKILHIFLSKIDKNLIPGQN